MDLNAASLTPSAAAQDPLTSSSTFYSSSSNTTTTTSATDTTTTITTAYNSHSNCNPSRTYFFKCVVVGVPSVGKTCLVNRLATGKFHDSPITTLNAATVQLSVPVPSRRGGAPEMAVVDLWDTAGQERYRSLTRSYFRDARAVLVAYDEKNVLTLGDWLKEVRHFVGGSEGGGGGGLNDSDALVFLIGTKLDLGEGVVLSARKVHELASTFGVDIAGSFALSAKTGAGLGEALLGVAEAVVSAGEVGRLDLTPRTGTIKASRNGRGRFGSRPGAGAREGRGSVKSWSCCS